MVMVRFTGGLQSAGRAGNGIGRSRRQQDIRLAVAQEPVRGRGGHHMEDQHAGATIHRVSLSLSLQHQGRSDGR